MTAPAPPADELLDLVDADNVVIGTVARAAVHGNPQLRHRAVHVFVHNRAGELLLQRRSTNKEIQPGRWDTSVGGHLAAGETYQQAAVRETAEELGVHIDAVALEHLHDDIWRSPLETEHTRTYRLVHDGPFDFDAQEISELRFWSTEQLRAALGSGQLTPYLEHELHRGGLL